jgi:hypothetical protein
MFILEKNKPDLDVIASRTTIIASRTTIIFEQYCPRKVKKQTNKRAETNKIKSTSSKTHQLVPLRLLTINMTQEQENEDELGG